MAFEDLTVRLGLDSSRFTAGLASASGKAAGFGSSMQGIGRQMSGVGKTMTAFVTGPIVAMGAGILKVGADFESSMNKVAAVTGASGQELDKMSEQAQELGRTTRFSASEAADAMSFLGMAGFETTEIMSAMPGVLDLAAAGNMEIAETADIASNILTGFGLEATEMTRVSDVMAATMTNANTDINQLGEAMSYVAPVASAMGISVEETAAAVGIMSDAGIQGSRAGTALRTALTALANPTDKVADKLAEYGIALEDVNPETNDLASIMGVLEDAGISAGDMIEIFGQRAGPGMIALLEEGAGGLSSFTEDLENSDGTAKRVADTMEKGLAGSLRELRSALEGVAIAIYESGMDTFFTRMIDRLAGFFSRLSEVNPAMLQLGVVVAGVVAAIGPFLWILGSLITAAGTVLNTFTPIVSFLFGPWGLAIAAAIAAGVLLYQNWEHIRAGAGLLMDAIRFVLQPFHAFGLYIAEVVSSGDTLNDWLTHLPGFLQPVAEAVGAAVNVFRDLGLAVGERLSEALRSAGIEGETLGEQLGVLGALIRDTVISAFLRLWEVAGEFLGAALSGLVTAAGNLIEAFTPLAHVVGEVVASAASNLASSLASIWEQLQRDEPSVFRERLNELGAALGINVRESGWLRDNIDRLMDRLHGEDVESSAFVQGLNTLGERLGINVREGGWLADNLQRLSDRFHGEDVESSPFVTGLNTLGERLGINVREGGWLADNLDRIWSRLQGEDVESTPFVAGLNTLGERLGLSQREGGWLADGLDRIRARLNGEDVETSPFVAGLNTLGERLGLSQREGGWLADGLDRIRDRLNGVEVESTPFVTGLNTLGERLGINVREGGWLADNLQRIRDRLNGEDVESSPFVEGLNTLGERLGISQQEGGWLADGLGRIGRRLQGEDVESSPFVEGLNTLGERLGVNVGEGGALALNLQRISDRLQGEDVESTPFVSGLNTLGERLGINVRESGWLSDGIQRIRDRLNGEDVASTPFASGLNTLGERLGINVQESGWLRDGLDRIGERLGVDDLSASSFMEGLNSLGESISSVATSALEFAQSVPERIREAFSSLGTFLSEWSGNLLGWLVSPFQDAYDRIVGNSIVPDLTDEVVRLLTELPGRIVTALSEMPGDFSRLFGEAKDRALERLAELRDDAIQRARDTWSGVTEWWDELSVDTDLSYSGIRDTVDEWMADARTSATSRANELWSNVTGWWDDLFADTDTSYSDIRTSINDWMSESRDSATDRANELWSNLTDQWDDLFGDTDSTYSDIRESINDWMTDSRESATDRAFELWDDVTDRWDTLFGDTDTSYSDIHDSVSTWMSDTATSAIDSANELLDDALAAWGQLESGTQTAFEAIAGFIWRPIEAAFGHVRDWINAILDAISGVLEAIGLDPISYRVGSGGNASAGPRGQGEGSDRGLFNAAGGVYGTPERHARGGLSRPSQPRYHVWGEGSYPEAFVTGDPAYRRQNQGYAAKAAELVGGTFVPYARGGYPGEDEGLPPPPTKPVACPGGHQHFARGGMDVAAFQLGGTTAGALAMNRQVESRWPVQGFNRHFSYLPQGVAERSIDWFVTAAGAQAQGEQKTVGDEIAAYVSPPSSDYVIWYNRANYGGGWQGYSGSAGIGNRNTLDHYDHVHATAHPGDTFRGEQGSGDTSGGGGGGPPWWQAVFDAAWDQLVKPLVDSVAGDIPGDHAVVAGARDYLTGDFLSGIRDWAVQKAGEALGFGGGEDNGGPGLNFDGGGTPNENRALGRQMNEAMGWGSHWSSLDNLWQRESGWNQYAANPTSDAYGIPQGMMGPGGHSPPPGYMPPESDPAVQIDWGLGYIAGRYNNPGGAWSHFASNNWYGEGGVIPGPMGEERMVLAHAGERVLPRSMAGAFDRLAESIEVWNARSGEMPDADGDLHDEVRKLREDVQAVDEHLDHIGLERRALRRMGEENVKAAAAYQHTDAYKEVADIQLSESLSFLNRMAGEVQ